MPKPSEPKKIIVSVVQGPEGNAMTEYWACVVCGYHPFNRQEWCDLGCGRDYNEMCKIPKSVARQTALLMQAIAEVPDPSAELDGYGNARLLAWWKTNRMLVELALKVKEGR